MVFDKNEKIIDYFHARRQLLAINIFALDSYVKHHPAFHTKNTRAVILAQG